MKPVSCFEIAYGQGECYVLHRKGSAWLGSGSRACFSKSGVNISSVLGDNRLKPFLRCGVE